MATGYLNHRAGSRMGAVHKVFDEKGRDAAMKKGVSLDLPKNTIYGWISVWTHPPKKGKKAKSAKRAKVAKTKRAKVAKPAAKKARAKVAKPRAKVAKPRAKINPEAAGAEA